MTSPITTEDLRKLLSETTPGPWALGQYSDTAGYDCMTGGVRSGPVVLDAADYGQKPCADLHIDDHFRMMADARLIALTPTIAAELITARAKLEAAEKLAGAVSELAMSIRAIWPGFEPTQLTEPLAAWEAAQ